jgi:hypothetical protein
MPELAYGSPPVPATPIGDLTRWHLDIRCSRCRRHVPLRIADLIAPYGHRTTIAGVVRRLGCSGLLGDGRVCHAPPRQVVLIEVEGKRRRREIVVIGARG